MSRNDNNNNNYNNNNNNNDGDADDEYTNLASLLCFLLFLFIYSTPSISLLLPSITSTIHINNSARELDYYYYYGYHLYNHLIHAQERMIMMKYQKEISTYQYLQVSSHTQDVTLLIFFSS